MKASEGINDPHANVINERSAKNIRKVQRNAEKQKTQLDNMSKDHIGYAGETSEYITGTDIFCLFAWCLTAHQHKKAISAKNR